MQRIAPGSVYGCETSQYVRIMVKSEIYYSL